MVYTTRVTLFMNSLFDDRGGWRDSCWLSTEWITLPIWLLKSSSAEDSLWWTFRWDTNMFIFFPFKEICPYTSYPEFLGINFPIMFFVLSLFFWLHHTACGILIPWPGIEPGPLAVKAWSPNHGTTRELPPIMFFLNPWPSNQTIGLWTQYIIACMGISSPSKVNNQVSAWSFALRELPFILLRCPREQL